VYFEYLHLLSFLLFPFLNTDIESRICCVNTLQKETTQNRTTWLIEVYLNLEYEIKELLLLVCSYWKLMMALFVACVLRNRLEEQTWWFCLLLLSFWMIFHWEFLQINTPSEPPLKRGCICIFLLHSTLNSRQNLLEIDTPNFYRLILLAMLQWMITMQLVENIQLIL